MVTKQQQLEWLAKEFAVWPGFGGVPVRMSSVTIGEVNHGLGTAHHITREEWQQERDEMQKQSARNEKLEWLARNVHKWDADAQCVCVETTENNNVIWINHLPVMPSSAFSKLEWLSMREELQNKPSWSDVPAWAEWIAQSGIDGSWEVYAGKPTPRKKRQYWSHHGYIGSQIDKQGEILGDWRDTIEARPLAMSISNSTTGTIINQTWKGVMKVTITTSGKSWHERGEFPPAGCECEAFADSCEPEVCTILAIHNGTAAVKWSKFNNGGLDVITLNGWSFRPLRTEREKAIDAACAAVCKAGPYDHERELIGKLYDAGMLK